MKILFLGDVVGRSGRSAVLNHLPSLIKKNNIDFTVINFPPAIWETPGWSWVTEALEKILSGRRCALKIAQLVCWVFYPISKVIQSPFTWKVFCWIYRFSSLALASISLITCRIALIRSRLARLNWPLSSIFRSSQYKGYFSISIPALAKA